jgi:hypothetical protein
MIKMVYWSKKMFKGVVFIIRLLQQVLPLLSVPTPPIPRLTEAPSPSPENIAPIERKLVAFHHHPHLLLTHKGTSIVVVGPGRFFIVAWPLPVLKAEEFRSHTSCRATAASPKLPNLYCWCYLGCSQAVGLGSRSFLQDNGHSTLGFQRY